MFNKPKIVLLNVELELKAERDNAEVRVDNVAAYQQVVDAEWDIIYEKLAKVSSHSQPPTHPPDPPPATANRNRELSPPPSPPPPRRADCRFGREHRALASRHR